MRIFIPIPGSAIPIWRRFTDPKLSSKAFSLRECFLFRLARTVLVTISCPKGLGPVARKRERIGYEKVSIGLDCGGGSSSADEPKRTSILGPQPWLLWPPLLRSWLLWSRLLWIFAPLLAWRLLVRRILARRLLGLLPRSGHRDRTLTKPDEIHERCDEVRAPLALIPVLNMSFG